MKTIKQILAGALSLILLFSLTACSKNTASRSDGEIKTIVVGATPSPHAEILEAVRLELEKEGYDLEIKEFTDYVIPDRSLAEGDLDANFYQHQPYLDDFNQENGTNLVSVASVHFEPLSIYKGKSDDLSNIPNGAKIAIPSDTSNGARALLLLEAQGIITLKEGTDLTATVQDIVEKKNNIEIVETEAAGITRVLQDVDFAVVNGNYALDAGITDLAIKGASELADSKAAEQYANIIAVRPEDKNKEHIKALVKAVQSDSVRTFIEEQYNGLVVPVF